MSTFLVSFDGEWQGKFDSLDEAVEWAQEVSGTGRMTWVVERRMSGRHRLRATFPEERRKEAVAEWDAWAKML